MHGCFLGNGLAWQACKLCLSDRWWEERELNDTTVMSSCAAFELSTQKKKQKASSEFSKDSSGGHDVAGFLMW